MAKQLLIDFYQCDDNSLNNLDLLKTITRKIVTNLRAKIVSECWHFFQPVGLTYIAIISKSHLSFHTWPEKKTIALDIFSCDDFLPQDFISQISANLNAQSYNLQTITRTI